MQLRAPAAWKQASRQPCIHSRSSLYQGRIVKPECMPQRDWAYCAVYRYMNAYRMAVKQHKTAQLHMPAHESFWPKRKLVLVERICRALNQKGRAESVRLAERVGYPLTSYSHQPVGLCTTYKSLPWHTERPLFRQPRTDVHYHAMLAV
jgi:hypothetical protein